MKQLLLALVVLSGLSAFAADEAILPALKHGLIGLSECKSASGNFNGKIYLHEDFLKREAYAVLAGDVKEANAKGSFAVFLVTNPDMDSKGLTLHVSREGKKLGTLSALALGLGGLKGTLDIDQDTLTCQPIAN